MSQTRVKFPLIIHTILIQDNTNSYSSNSYPFFFVFFFVECNPYPRQYKIYSYSTCAQDIIVKCMNNDIWPHV